MFDGQNGVFLWGAFLFAGFLSIASQSRPPDLDGAIAIETASLPALPETARPDGSPAQPEVPAQTVDLGHGFQATLLYGYVLEGEVVSRKQFWTDPVSEVSPLDLGIIWGDLAEDGTLDALSFRAGNRVLWSRYEAGTTLPSDWEEHVTNNHLIPASADVRDALMAVREGQRVRLRGYLVTVTGENIWPWRSSTRRDDSTIIGGCEIILVRDVEVLGEVGS